MLLKNRTLIRYLIYVGADVNSVAPYVLSGVSQAGNYGVVQRLLKSGADPSLLKWTPLMREVAIGSARDVAREIRSAFSVHDRDRWERTPWLISLVIGGNAELMKWLIESGADVNATDDGGHTALMEAARLGNAACVRVLIDSGANVQAEDHVQDQAINYAANSDVASLLVAAGADINSIAGTGEFLLKSAASSGDVGFVRDLLRLGARVETTSTGETALHGAALEDQIEVMQLLLDAGSDPNALDVDDEPPLDYAWSIPAIELLLNAGADAGLAHAWADEYPYHDDPEILAFMAAYKRG